MNQVKCARVNWELWQSGLTNSLDVSVENVTNYLLACWHLAKMRNTINTLCLLYKVFKINVMCGTRKAKEYSSREGKKRVGHMTNTCKYNGQTKLSSSCIFSQNWCRTPTFYQIKIFASNFQPSSSNDVPGFTFVYSFSAKIYKD